MPSLDDTFGKMVTFYAEGNLPWDDTLPPPEVRATVAHLTPGKALDLGCGFGRASFYMASHGWQVDALDFVPAAIATAQDRLHQLQTADDRFRPKITFHQASITDLSFLHSTYDFALDVGCSHALNHKDLAQFSHSLSQSLRKGATFLCFGRLCADADEVGFDQAHMLEQFSKQFTLDKIEFGTTHNPESTWQTAWFWFSKK